MKKYLFFIVATAAIASLEAQAIVKVGGDTDVKVKGETLFYVGGDVDIANYTATDKKVLNEGNIRVTGAFKNANTDGSNFVNAASSGKYGQLIIDQDKAVTGKIASMIKYNTAFIYHSLAIPYTGITAKEVVAQSYTGKTDTDISNSFVGYKGGGKYFDPDRIKNPLFAWDNTAFYLKNLGISDEIDPTAYYALNKGSELGEFSTINFTSIQGKPNNANKNVTINEYSIPNNNDVNNVGEYYGSYIIDYTVALPTNWGSYTKTVSANGFGSNIFNFGNPYTSNIDLGKLDPSFLGKVQALVQYDNQNYKTTINEGTATGSLGKTSSFSAFVPGVTVGDQGLGYVRPFQTFSVKMKDGFSSATLNFGDNIKTFKAFDTTTPNILYNRKTDVRGGINQVGLDLYDNVGNNTGNRVYVVASNIYEASQKGEGAEVYNVAIGDDDTAIYTLQEQEDGTVDENLANSKTYINGVNADKYVGKPIHLVFQNGKGHYTLKARLNEDLANNKNKFYFEDKSNGKVVEVNKNFEYSFDIKGTDKDRFVLYWAKKPQQINEREIAKEVTNTVIIFKNGNDHLIRFSKPSNDKANVFVYNISGQLMVSKAVDTNKDYIIPVKGVSSVYVVKVVEANGKVTVKKIIK